MAARSEETSTVHRGGYMVETELLRIAEKDFLANDHVRSRVRYVASGIMWRYQSVTVGTSRDTYAYNGRSGDIDLLLWPINFNLAYVGYTVLEPFVGYGVEAGIQYLDKEIIGQRLQKIPEELVSCLRARENAKPIQFNMMSDWDANGRIIKTSAPPYSAFIRHKKEIDLG